MTDREDDLARKLDEANKALAVAVARAEQVEAQLAALHEAAQETSDALSEHYDPQDPDIYHSYELREALASPTVAADMHDAHVAAQALRTEAVRRDPKRNNMPVHGDGKRAELLEQADVIEQAHRASALHRLQEPTPVVHLMTVYNAWPAGAHIPPGGDPFCGADPTAATTTAEAMVTCQNCRRLMNETPRRR